jgi:hypothetical protein
VDRRAVSWPRRLVGALVVAAAAVAGLVACSGGSEGTVVAKTQQKADDFGCRMGGTLTGPVSVPAWGACNDPQCWQLVVRADDGSVSELCVSREEYEATQLGAFWHGRTDR